MSKKSMIWIGAIIVAISCYIYFAGLYDLSNPKGRLRYWTIPGTEESPTIIYITPIKFSENQEVIMPEIIATSEKEDTIYVGNRWGFAHLYDRFQKPVIIRAAQHR